MNLPGIVAQLAAKEALANVGVHEEGGENRGKYVETYLRSVGLSAGAPWCAAFVYYRLLQACHNLSVNPKPVPPKSGYCPDWQDWAKDNGIWLPVDTEERILPGDLALFYFPAKGRVAHIGIVVGRMAEGQGVYTVEGNTGPERGEVNREGDGVYRKEREWQEFGSRGGFIRLPW
jgi:CHAP domain